MSPSRLRGFVGHSVRSAAAAPSPALMKLSQGRAWPLNCFAAPPRRQVALGQNLQPGLLVRADRVLCLRVLLLRAVPVRLRRRLHVRAEPPVQRRLLRAVVRQQGRGADTLVLLLQGGLPPPWRGGSRCPACPGDGSSGRRQRPGSRYGALTSAVMIMRLCCLCERVDAQASSICTPTGCHNFAAAGEAAFGGSDPEDAGSGSTQATRISQLSRGGRPAEPGSSTAVCRVGM
eukprot:SAG22_NODE_209_length_15177_cov_9.282995_15_plen_232_part_00